MQYLHNYVKMVDDDSKVVIEDLVVDYDRRFCLDRVLKSGDGVVAIDLSVIENMLALYIHVDGPITVNNGVDLIVSSDLILLNAEYDLTFTIQNKGTVDRNISIRAYGVAD
jgi:hypothetical protein